MTAITTSTATAKPSAIGSVDRPHGDDMGMGVPAAFVAVQDWRGRRPRRWAAQL
jgi:hypothetical protein